jgi:hypothetical protein
MTDDFLLFLAVGFFAQLVDGSLGMAYGITATTFMLSAGVPPAHASAATHAAEVFTTAASGGSHVMHRNVDWPLFWRLAPAGMIGGAAGAFILTSFDGDAMRPFIFAYLGLMGVYVLFRTLRPVARGRFKLSLVPPLGMTGGFFDATGGGGWGPIVTTTLLGAGEKPRFAIGTTNTAEFLVTVTITATFVVAFLTGHWEQDGSFMRHASAVAGLIVGGVAAAPLAGYVVKVAPPRIIGLLVGTLILSLSIYQLIRYAG